MPREEERHESWAATSEIARTNADHRVIHARAKGRAVSITQQCRFVVNTPSYSTAQGAHDLIVGGIGLRHFALDRAVASC
jgi:hypothetical protein